MHIHRLLIRDAKFRLRNVYVTQGVESEIVFPHLKNHFRNIELVSLTILRATVQAGV